MAEEEKIEQHIIADRTLIRTARIISGILTPFSIPFLAFLVLFLFSYLRIMPVQTHRIGNCLLLHHPDAYHDHLPVPQSEWLCPPGPERP